MKTRKLSPAMSKALSALRGDLDRRPIYIEDANDLGISRGTLRALTRRGLIDCNIEWPSVWTLVK